MYQVFPTVRARSGHWHALHGSTPLLRRHHGSAVRAETDHHHTLAQVSFAHELADVDHAGQAHVREARITDVRIVRPYNGSAPWAMVQHESLESLDHVLVAQVPGGWSGPHHRPVI